MHAFAQLRTHRTLSPPWCCPQFSGFAPRARDDSHGAVSR